MKETGSATPAGSPHNVRRQDKIKNSFFLPLRSSDPAGEADPVNLFYFS